MQLQIKGCIECQLLIGIRALQASKTREKLCAPALHSCVRGFEKPLTPTINPNLNGVVIARLASRFVTGRGVGVSSDDEDTEQTRTRSSFSRRPRGWLVRGERTRSRRSRLFSVELPRESSLFSAGSQILSPISLSPSTQAFRHQEGSRRRRRSPAGSARALGAALLASPR